LAQELEGAQLMARTEAELFRKELHGALKGDSTPPNAGAIFSCASHAASEVAENFLNKTPVASSVCGCERALLAIAQVLFERGFAQWCKALRLMQMEKQLQQARALQHRFADKCDMSEAEKFSMAATLLKAEGELEQMRSRLFCWMMNTCVLNTELARKSLAHAIARWQILVWLHAAAPARIFQTNSARQGLSVMCLFTLRLATRNERVALQVALMRWERALRQMSKQRCIRRSTRRPDSNRKLSLPTDLVTAQRELGVSTATLHDAVGPRGTGC